MNHAESKSAGLWKYRTSQDSIRKVVANKTLKQFREHILEHEPLTHRELHHYISYNIRLPHFLDQLDSKARSDPEVSDIQQTIKNT